MDATRTRRVRDRARQDWYARHRQWRFARHLGFVGAGLARREVAERIECSNPGLPFPARGGAPERLSSSRQ
jgi:hypothetical protein